MRTSNVNKAWKSQRTKRRRVCSKGWKKGRHRGQFAKHLKVFAFPVLFFFLRSAIAGSHGTMRANRKKTTKMKRQNGIFAWLRDEKRVAIHADCFRACLSMCARSWVDVIGTPLNMVCRSAPVVHLMFFFFFSGRICCRGLRSPPWLLLFRPQSSPITSRELRKEETEREPRNVRRVPGAMMAARTSRIGAFPLDVLSSTVYEVCSLGSTVQSRVCFYK